MTSLKVVHDVLTSTSLCFHMMLLQRRKAQYFKTIPCFCKFDLHEKAQTAQIAQNEHHVFTKALEMAWPILKEVDSQGIQLLPWQHTFILIT